MKQYFIFYILQVNEHSVVLYSFSKQSTIERDWPNPRGINGNQIKDLSFILTKTHTFLFYLQLNLYVNLYSVSKGGSTKRRDGNGVLFISIWK